MNRSQLARFAAAFAGDTAPQAAEGGFLEFVGPRHPVDARAAEAGTIGHEILPSLGGRYARSHADTRIERLSA